MSKVLFTKINSYSETEKISSAAAKLIQKIQEEEKVLDFKKEIPLKVHFGEEGCTTFIEPKNFEGIIKYLKSEKTKAGKKEGIFFTETNVLYKGKRTTKESHTAIAKEHGFTQLPIEIADGEMGEEYRDVDISGANPKPSAPMTTPE